MDVDPNLFVLLWGDFHLNGFIVFLLTGNPQIRGLTGYVRLVIRPRMMKKIGQLVRVDGELRLALWQPATRGILSMGVVKLLHGCRTRPGLCWPRAGY